jgi:esterase/lipase
MRNYAALGLAATLALAGVVGCSGGDAASPAGAAAGAPAAGRGGGGARPPMPVEFAQVSRGNVAERVTIVGNLIGAATVEAVPLVNGRLQSVNVRLGDSVRRGQAIAKIEDREIVEQIKQAEATFAVSQATIRQRQADLKLAQNNMERSKSLYERDLLPRQTFDDTDARYQAAQAQLELSMAQLEQTKSRLDELKIKRAAIVGWSDGAAIALDLGIRHAARVTKLFVFATNFDANGSKPRKAGQSPTFNRYAVKCKTDYLKLAPDPKRYEAVVDSLMPVWTNTKLFTKDELRSIKAPTVVADGDHDEILKMSQIEEMAKLIPTAKLVVFRDTSHFAHWQDPAGFTKAVQEWLAWTP